MSFSLIRSTPRLLSAARPPSASSSSSTSLSSLLSSSGIRSSFSLSSSSSRVFSRSMTTYRELVPPVYHSQEGASMWLKQAIWTNPYLSVTAVLTVIGLGLPILYSMIVDESQHLRKLEKQNRINRRVLEAEYAAKLDANEEVQSALNDLRYEHRIAFLSLPRLSVSDMQFLAHYFPGASNPTLEAKIAPARLQHVRTALELEVWNVTDEKFVEKLNSGDRAVFETWKQAKEKLRNENIADRIAKKKQAKEKLRDEIIAERIVENIKKKRALLSAESSPASV